jgi:DNA-binding transcriptional MerR regulator
MITTNELIAKTKITYPQLNRLKELGILPKPKLTSQGRGKGVIGEYEDDVVDIINRVEILKRQGVKLSDIAEIIKPELAEIKTFKPSEEYLIPIDNHEIQSYISAYQGLHDWINKQIDEKMPGYEFHSVEMEKVVKQGTEYLYPKEIKVKPPENKK